MKTVIVISILALATSSAAAEQRTFYGRDGGVVGRSSTDSQGSTTIYDRSGRVTGRTSTDSQGTTTIYDDRGRVIGRSSGGGASAPLPFPAAPSADRYAPLRR